LGNRKGELKAYHLDLTREDLNDPGTNICAGIRWLFYKRGRASAKLGRQASWEEGVAEYKSLTRKLKARTKSIRDRARELFDRFKRYYKQYHLLWMEIPSIPIGDVILRATPPFDVMTLIMMKMRTP
jgi:hypothetical protein